MVDAVKDFAYSTVATAPSPATTGTSLTLQSGTGALFPAAPFSATVWPTGVLPLMSNAEIVRVTAVATDTFTITRAQEGTAAQTIVAGWQIAQTITAAFISEILAANVVSWNGRQGDVVLELSDVEALYPGVGALLIGTGSGTTEFLSSGAAGTVLTSAGTTALPAWEVLPTYPQPATTVAGPASFGSSAVVGSLTTEYALADHDHGLPVLPVLSTAHTYAITGPVSVPVGPFNQLPPFFEPVANGTSKTLVAVQYVIQSGGSATFEVLQNGVVVGGLSALSATTTIANTAPTATTTVANGDSFEVVVTATTATPQVLTVSFFFETVLP